MGTPKIVAYLLVKIVSQPEVIVHGGKALL